MDLVFIDESLLTYVTTSNEVDNLDRNSVHHNVVNIIIDLNLNNNINNSQSEVHKKKILKNYSKMRIKHIKNIISNTPLFISEFTETIFDRVNDKQNIYNRIKSYTKFLVQTQNHNKPNSKPKMKTFILGNVIENTTN